MFKGNSGTAWFNGKLLATLSKIEAKNTLEYEDRTYCGTYNTHKEYIGWTGEGTLTRDKVDSSVLSMMKDAMKNGTMPEITIISKMTNTDTGKTERVALKEICITEVMLTAFEAKKTVEEEIPFTYGDFDVLEEA